MSVHLRLNLPITILNYMIISSKVSDFVIGVHTFEVGGKKKGAFSISQEQRANHAAFALCRGEKTPVAKKRTKQIEDIPNGHIVKDNIEYGYGIAIPLWTLGLLY